MSERIIGKSNFKTKNVLLSLVLGMEQIAFSATFPLFERNSRQIILLPELRSLLTFPIVDKVSGFPVHEREFKRNSSWSNKEIQRNSI